MLRRDKRDGILVSSRLARDAVHRRQLRTLRGRVPRLSRVAQLQGTSVDDSSLNAAGNADGEGNANQNMDSVPKETTEKSLGSKQLANKDSAL